MKRTPAPDSQKLLKKLAQLPICQGLSEETLAFLADHGLGKSYKKGSYIWRAQQRGEFCAMIVDGLVEIGDSTAAGDGRVLAVFGPGDIIGLSAVLKRGTYPANALVTSQSCGIIQLYIRSAEANEPFAQDLQIWLREMLLRHEQVLREQVLVLSAGRVQMQIAEFLEQLRQRFAPTENSEQFSIPLPISKSQVARVIGVRTETVIRILNQWERDGLLKMNLKGVQVRAASKLTAVRSGRK